MGVNESNEVIKRAGRVLARLVIVVFLGLVALVNKRDTFWPAITWPMFSTKTPQYPGDTYIAELFYVVDASGSGIWVRDADLWGFDRYSIAKDLIAGALDTDVPRHVRHRRAILELIRYRYPELEPDRIEIWRSTWDIDLDATKPLYFDSPRDSVLLASFTPDEVLPVATSPDTQP